jgi:hypothetical protein
MQPTRFAAPTLEPLLVQAVPPCERHPGGNPAFARRLPAGLMPWQHAGPRHQGPSDRAHLPSEHW